MKLIQKVAGLLRTSPGLGRWALRCTPDWRWTLNIEPIGPFLIRIRRHRSYWLRSPLTHDRFLFGVLERLVKPGDVVYDVGANIGLYTRFLVQHFKAGRVIAFEPMTDTFEILKINVSKNPDVAARTTLFKLAVGDVESEEKFQVDDMSSASSTLDRVTGGEPSAGRQQYGLPPRVEMVKVMPLDVLIGRESLPPPNLIKLDIEGAAALALTGMSQTLDKHHPDLVVETHNTTEAGGVFRTLASHGYHCFGMVEREGKQGYFELKDSDIRPVDNYWQPHHLIASMNAEKLRAEIKPHHCWIS